MALTPWGMSAGMPRMGGMMQMDPWMMAEDPWAMMPQQMGGQHFGMVPFERELRNMERGQRHMMRNLMNQMPHARTGMSEIVNDDTHFQVNLDCSHFAPEEIKVRMVDNNVIVEGSHEEKPDEHGYISRNFSRRYILPKDVKADDVVSKLSPSGYLTIEAPKLAIEGKKNERILSIQKTAEEPMKLAKASCGTKVDPKK